MELYDKEPPELPSHVGSIGWAALCAGVVIFDLTARETLSAACKRGVENKYTRPFVLGGIALVGCHLAQLIPEKRDPLKSLARQTRALHIQA